MRDFTRESPEYERGYARCLNDMLHELSIRHEHAVMTEDVDRYVERLNAGRDADGEVYAVVPSVQFHKDIVAVLEEMDASVDDLNKALIFGLLEVSDATD